MNKFEKGYYQGMLDAFIDITTCYHGKQYYFPQDDGSIYSRESGKYMTLKDAIEEFEHKTSDFYLDWEGKPYDV